MMQIIILPWIMRNVANLVKEKEAYVMFRRLRSDRAFEEHKGSYGEFKQEIRRAKKGP